MHSFVYNGFYRVTEDGQFTVNGIKHTRPTSRRVGRSPFSQESQKSLRSRDHCFLRLFEYINCIFLKSASWHNNRFVSIQVPCLSFLESWRKQRGMQRWYGESGFIAGSHRWTSFGKRFELKSFEVLSLAWISGSPPFFTSCLLLLLSLLFVVEGWALNVYSSRL